MQKPRLNEQSIMVSVADQQLHLTRLYLDDHHLGMPVFMLPGALQSSEVFYPADEKQQREGLAHYLARQGFDVFIADLRGKGKAWPQLSGHSQFGVHQLITEDLPALIHKVTELRPGSAQLWIGQGWGGVLLNACFARFGDQLAPVKHIVQFGVRRHCELSSTKKRWVLGVVWHRLYQTMAALSGYLPLAKWRMASSNESQQCLKDYLQWSAEELWSDPVDGFDYGAAILQQQLPPSLYFVAQGDTVYGELGDVRRFMREQGQHDARMILLSKKGGNQRNYSHKGMLVHSDCEQDHFPLLLSWLNEYESVKLAS